MISSYDLDRLESIVNNAICFESLRNKYVECHSKLSQIIFVNVMLESIEIAKEILLHQVNDASANLIGNFTFDSFQESFNQLKDLLK